MRLIYPQSRQLATALMWYTSEIDGLLNVLPDPDPVLRKRGDEAEVLTDLSADDQVTTAMFSRKNRVLNSPYFTCVQERLTGSIQKV